MRQSLFLTLIVLMLSNVALAAEPSIVAPNYDVEFVPPSSRTQFEPSTFTNTSDHLIDMDGITVDRLQENQRVLVVTIVHHDLDQVKAVEAASRKVERIKKAIKAIGGKESTVQMEQYTVKKQVITSANDQGLYSGHVTYSIGTINEVNDKTQDIIAELKKAMPEARISLAGYQLNSPSKSSLIGVDYYVADNDQKTVSTKISANKELVTKIVKSYGVQDKDIMAQSFEGVGSTNLLLNYSTKEPNPDMATYQIKQRLTIVMNSDSDIAHFIEAMAKGDVVDVETTEEPSQEGFLARLKKKISNLF